MKLDNQSRLKSGTENNKKGKSNKTEERAAGGIDS
jgi:hypothetical protein